MGAREPEGLDGETVTFLADNSKVVDAPPNLALYAICECDGRPVIRTFTVVPQDVAPK